MLNTGLGEPSITMRIKSLAIGLSLVLLGFGLGGRASSAAPTGLTISPAFQMVTIQAGAASQPVSFKITNDQPAAQDLSFSVRDFNTLNESGGLFFVGTNPTALQKKYGLAKWLSLSTSQVIIQPHQTFTLDGQILNQPSLSPGGHYGALLISIGGGPAGGQVSLEPIASSLLFVTKPAGATHFLSLSNVSFKHSLLSLPPAVNLRFQNTGNTHVVPRGVVNITDGHGRLISKGIINQNSAIVLPQTYRQLSVPMQKIVSPGRPGQYQLTVDFRFDGINQY
ncbi:MAG TPA: hypothetical protein VFK97_00020, partial [Candidatus Saccharimonadales bacterium]|nr:hypothetical protein [Candidatus Saccharimonadales bacterium]